MLDSVALFHCTRPYLTATTVRQLRHISMALLAMSGRVPMLSLSRWAGKGGSYRTVQRFFSTGMPWESAKFRGGSLQCKGERRTLCPCNLTNHLR